MCWQKPSRADSQCAKRWRTRRRRILDAQGLGQGQQKLTLPPLHPSRAEQGSSPRRYLRVRRGGNCIRTSVTEPLLPRAGFSGSFFWYGMVEDFRCSTRARRPRRHLLDARPATAPRRAPGRPGNRGGRCSTRARQPRRHVLDARPATSARRAPGNRGPRRQLLDARPATATRRAPGNRGDICSMRARRQLFVARPATAATAARRAPGDCGDICSTRARRLRRHLLDAGPATSAPLC